MRERNVSKSRNQSRRNSSSHSQTQDLKCSQPLRMSELATYEQQKQELLMNAELFLASSGLEHGNTLPNLH